MTVSEAIEQAQSLTGQVFEVSVMLRWLNELDGQIAFDVYGLEKWKLYVAGDDTKPLAVPFPWDGAIYTHWLEANTYFANGEYDRYANARTIFESALADFKKTVQRTKTRCGDVTIPIAGNGGSGDEQIMRRVET